MEKVITIKINDADGMIKKSVSINDKIIYKNEMDISFRFSDSDHLLSLIDQLLTNVSQ